MSESVKRVEVADSSQRAIEEKEPARGPQSAELNASFADKRRKQELEEIKGENQKIKQRLEHLKTALSLEGYEGEDALERFVADKRGESSAGEVSQELYAENERLKAELEAAKQRESLKVLNDDLEQIKRAHPELKASSIDELGQEFISLMYFSELNGNRLDPVKAYEATRKDYAAEIGSVTRDSVSGEKDFYTSEEVDRLSDKELENPKLREIIRKSMAKW